MTNSNDLPASDIIHRGLLRIIAVARDSKGIAHASVYFETECDAKSLKQLRHTFQVIGDVGEFGANTERFKRMEGQKDLHAFKAFQARVSAYRDGDVWFLLAGFTKKKDKWPLAEVERALRLLDEHRALRKKKR